MANKPLKIDKRWIKKVQKIAKLHTAEETYDFFIRHKRRAFDDKQWSQIMKSMEEVLQDEKKGVNKTDVILDHSTHVYNCGDHAD